MDEKVIWYEITSNIDDWIEIFGTENGKSEEEGT